MSPPRIALWRDRLARFALGASPTMASAVTGVVRNKWLAIHLEASGMGVLAQVFAAQAWLGTLAGLGLALPIARRVGAAVASRDETAVRRAVWTALSLAARAALGAALLGVVFAGPISKTLFGTSAHAALIRVSMLGVAGFAISLPLQGLFAGRSDLRAPLALTVVGGTIAVVTAIALVPRFGLTGGVWSGAILFPVGVAGALFLSRRTYARVLLPPTRPLLEPALARALLATGSAALALPLIEAGSLLALRSHYLRLHGVSANGLLQAAVALPQQVGALFYAYLGSHAFGRVSGLAGAASVREYTRRQWAPILLLAALFFALATLASTPLLHLLYSSRFDAARPMMAWALLGEFCRVAAQAWALGALPLGGARLWLAIGIAQPIALAAGYALFTLSGAGIQSLPYAYAAAGVFQLLVAGLSMSRTGVTLTPRGVVLALALVALLGALARWVAG